MPILAPPLPASPPPTAPPVRPESRFKRLRMFWTGWDGSTWEITDPKSGTFLTDGGTRGLHFAPRTRWTSESPALAGSIGRGGKTNERECFWPLFLYSDESSEEWLARDRAFWKTMRGGKYGTWTVQTPDGQQRQLRCQYDPSDDGYERDPFRDGWHLYGVPLIAEQPYWYGPLVKRSFQNEAPVPFFGAEHVPVPADDLLFISSGSTLASATIDNPGDVDAAPIAVFDGPWDSGAEFGIGTNVTAYGASVPSGKSVVIDTRSDRLGAKQIDTPTAEPGSDEWMDAISVEGVDKFTSLSTVALGVVVPADEEAPLSIAATGAGNVHVVLQPLYERAW